MVWDKIYNGIKPGTCYLVVAYICQYTNTTVISYKRIPYNRNSLITVMRT